MSHPIIFLLQKTAVRVLGAAIGGYALDNIGLTSPLMLSGTLMLLTALLVTAKVKMKKS